MTINRAQAGDNAGVPSRQEQHLRHGAILMIACGITAADLRGWVTEKPGGRDAGLYLALAGEVESLTERGLTKRHAARARGYNLTEASVGVSAALYLDEGLTPTQARALMHKATPSRARFLARVADDMDRILAEEARAGAKGR